MLPIPPPALAEAPLWFVALVIVLRRCVFLSYWPVRNMLSHSQRMNMSFNPFHLVNTYGAFGSIGRIRREVVIEGTEEPTTEQTVWKEYEFKGKPGAVRRLPRQWAPYHLRLDWLMWFAAISPDYAQPWLTPFLERLLRNDSPTLRLLRHNPFPDSRPVMCAPNSTSTASPHRPNCGAIALGGIARCWVHTFHLCCYPATTRRCRFLLSRPGK